MKFGQLILRRIVKIVATECSIVSCANCQEPEALQWWLAASQLILQSLAVAD